MEDFPETQSSRPLWLITLADLGLLLVGFFVFLQASQTIDRKALAKGFREGFVAQEVAPVAVASAAVGGFTPGSAILTQSPADAIRFARDALADPRLSIRIAGQAGGFRGDVDPDTGSAELLALDRARAVARAITEAGVHAPGRITITASNAGQSRLVLVTQGFTGEAK